MCSKSFFAGLSIRYSSPTLCLVVLLPVSYNTHTSVYLCIPLGSRFICYNKPQTHVSMFCSVAFRETLFIEERTNFRFPIPSYCITIYDFQISKILSHYHVYSLNFSHDLISGIYPGLGTSLSTEKFLGKFSPLHHLSFLFRASDHKNLLHRGLCFLSRRVTCQ